MHWLIDWLIDWLIGVYAVWAIFQPFNDWKKNVAFGQEAHCKILVLESEHPPPHTHTHIFTSMYDIHRQEIWSCLQNLYFKDKLLK